MTTLTVENFTVGMRVRIAAVPSTLGYHFLPSAPGNTATVIAVDPVTDVISVDLDEIKDSIERSEELRELNAINRKDWGFAPHELLIEDEALVSK